MTRPARLRCDRGHYLPRSFRPRGDPEDWDDTCRCRPTQPATPPERRPPGGLVPASGPLIIHEEKL